MSRSAYGAIDFLREVTQGARVWILDALVEAPSAITGERSQPMWSSAERAAKALAHGRLAGTGQLVEIPWSQFLTEWVPRIERGDLKVGLNWSGPDVTGVGWSIPLSLILSPGVSILSGVGAGPPPDGVR